MVKSIQLGFDKDAAWNKVNGRHTIVLDTNCWIDMADEKNAHAVVIRDHLRKIVSNGDAVCPLSWALIEELFKQSGDSQRRSASLMEELSLNVTYVMRKEAFDWEVERSVRLLTGQAVSETQNGLFAPVAAFVGSRFNLMLPNDVVIQQAAQDDLRAYAKRELGKIGLIEMLELLKVPPEDKFQPPAYSQAAKTAMAITKGDKKKLFILEATEIFKTYVVPSVMRFSPLVVAKWMENFDRLHIQETFVQDYLTGLPALFNYIEIMATVDSQPSRKDKHNDFFDYEIVAVPMAYSTAFVSQDKGIRDLLRHRTEILKRTKTHYCDGLEALEQWLKDQGLW